MDFNNTPISAIILITTVGISLWTMFGNRILFDKMILSPYRVIYEKKWYLVITSSFIHADMFHLMFNMLTFYFFAFKLESVLGPWRFLLIYFGCMILADVTTIIKQKDNYGYGSLGASGAISGILFSSILFFPKASLGIMFFPIPIPAPIFAVLYLAYCYYASRRAGDMINHEAHLWGALAGIILTVLIVPESLTWFISQVF
jgi:membrane associated rhomboid family serine protease